MLSKLRSWLNDPSDYWKGVGYFKELGEDDYSKKLYSKRDDQFNRHELHKDLSTIYDQLKVGKVPDLTTGGFIPASKSSPTNDVKQIIVFDTDLTRSCKLEADKAYKVQMNTRALLFKLCPVELDRRENHKERVAERYKLVQELMQQVKNTDKLYANYRYAQQHGSLPNTPEVVQKKLSPIELVNKKNNLMKNISFHKRHKDQSPKRLNMIQQKEAELKGIENELSGLG